MVKISLVTVAALAGAVVALGADPTTGRVTYSTSVGSFKLLGLGDEPAIANLTFSFTGTVLVSGLNGTVKVGGKVRKEYEDVKHKKVAYFGTGTMTVSGKVTSIQWFGRDLKADLVGKGVIRLYGEFDRNLSTGVYRYNGGEEMPWGTGGTQVLLPRPVMKNPDTGASGTAPTVRDAGKG